MAVTLPEPADDAGRASEHSHAAPAASVGTGVARGSIANLMALPASPTFQPLPKADGPSFTTHAASITDSGTQYTVRISNGNGEVVSQAAVLTVSEAMFSN